MPKLKVTPFTSYDFTDEEYLVAVKLTALQEQHIQSLLAAAAQEKIVIQYDDTHPHLASSQEAYLRGQIDILNHILGLSANSELAMAELMRKKEEALLEDVSTNQK